MRRIFSYNLALLFYFLQDKTLNVPYVVNRISKETLDSMVDNLEDIANDSKHPLFNKEVQNGLYIISVEEPQRHILKDYLEKYCSELVNNRLETRDTRVLDWNVAREEFIKRVARFNLNCFITHDIYDMPQLAPELIKLHDNGSYRLEIEIKPVTNRISVESFNFKCSLNLSSIIEDKIKPNSKSKKKDPKQEAEQEKRKRTKFTNKPQKLYDYLKRKAKTGKFSFIKSDFTNNKSLSMTMSTVYMDVNRLNEQYQEIYDTEEILLKGDRGAEEYILNNVWGYKNFN